MDDANIDEDSQVQSHLFPLIEQWTNELSFVVADEVRGFDGNCMQLWSQIEQVLTTLHPSHIKLLLVKQHHLLDIILQFMTIKVFKNNRELWQLAVRSLSRIHVASGSFIWQSTEYSPADVISSLVAVLDLTVQKSVEAATNLKYSMQALSTIAQLISSSECFSTDAYSTWLHYLSEVMSITVSSTIYKRKLAVFVQSHLFALAKAARAALEDIRCAEMYPDSKSDAVGGVNAKPDSGIPILPLGGSDQLLQVLCTHRHIAAHPSIILAILRSHAAVCSLPVSVSSTATLKAEPRKRKLLDGLRDQHKLVSDFLSHLQLCVADGTLALDATATFRADLISTCAALICSSNVILCGNARRLVCLVVTGQQDMVAIADSATILPVRKMMGGAASISKYGGALLDGMRKMVGDQLDLDLMGTDAESVAMCGLVDDVVEVVLEYAISRTVMYDSTISELLKVLSDVLVTMSKQKRPKLSAALQVVLQKGAHCSIRGCLPLIEANHEFLGVAPTAPDDAGKFVKHSLDGGVASSSMSTANGAYTEKKIPIVDLCGPDVASAANHQKTSASSGSITKPDDWSFLKPAPKPAPPKAPLSRLDNSITRTELAKKTAQETTWQRLEREEQEQLAQEKRALIRKRIFGDIDSSSNGLSAADDLMSRAKFARADEEEWLGPRQAPAQKDGQWQDQLRELKEAKERARAKIEWQRKHDNAGKASSSGASVDAPSAMSAAAPPQRVRRQSSALLENQQDASDGDSSDELTTGGTSAVRRVADWREFLKVPSTTAAGSATSSSTTAQRDLTDVSNIMQMYQQALQAQRDGSNGSRAGGRALPSIAQSLAEISIDPLIRKLLRCNFAELCNDARNNKVSDKPALKEVPVRFLHEEDYISSFQPLLLEEVKSALIGQINGERSEDSTRAGSAGSGVSAAVKIRCVLRNARVGQPKLQEAQVIVIQADTAAGDGATAPADRGADRGKLMKDDLVLVMQSFSGNDRLTLQDLIAHPHALALVMTANSRNQSHGGSSSSGEARDKENKAQKQQQTLLMLAGTAPPQDTARWCVPVMGLSSFLREWSALMSIRNHRLVPLAPYLLKGSPVVSSQHLSALHDGITTKLKALEYNPHATMSEERRTRFNTALLQDLTQVRGLYVDGSVLKNTGIAKTVKNITAAASRLIGSECETLAAEIITQWKAQVKNDHKASTIRNMKGGKLIEMPADKNIERPRCVPQLLWDKFAASYNISQLFAIKYVSDQFEGGQDTRIALVQGPPGTGKTSTILGMVAALLSHSATAVTATDSGGTNSNSSTSTPPTGARRRLLICAPSNTAVDELLTRLSAGVLDHTGQLRPVRIVRLGEPLEGSSQAIQKLTLDAQIEDRMKQDPAWAKLQSSKELIRSLEKEYDALPTRLKSLAYSNSSAQPSASESAAGNALSKDQQRVRNLRSEIANQRQVKIWAELSLERARNALRQAILLEADIVGATLSGSGRKQFLDLALHNDVTFDTTIIDEAAQTTEPSCLIPLRLGCRRLVLVGDPRQLPATVLCKAAAVAGLGRSLFERLERADHEVVMLTIQYRMHPDIRRFPSRYFYQNLLTDAPEAIDLQPLSIYRTALSPVRFLDLRTTSDSPAGKSFRNEGEVQLVMNLLTTLLPHFTNATVAIITPYKAQVNRFKAALRDVPEVASLQGDRRWRDLEVEVNSIDGFQGREKDVVIFSAVRSSNGGSEHRYDQHNQSYADMYRSASAHSNGRSIGFVGDERRLNVAITRAKRLMIIVGNGRTLSTDLTWSSMLQDLQERDLVRPVNRLDSSCTGDALIQALAYE